VNEEDFHSEGNVKILWILKEANVSPEDIDKVRNLCEEFREGGHQKNALSVPTFRKMIYTSYWIYILKWNGQTFLMQMRMSAIQLLIKSLT
jgi:hypothetical protein